MEQIKNKRISRDTIKQIVCAIKERYVGLCSHYEQYQEETKKDYNDPVNEQIKEIVVNGKPRFEISIATANQTETKDGEVCVDWLANSLDNNAKNIEDITISFFSFYCRNTSNNNYYKGDRSQEDVYIVIKKDYLSVSFTYLHQSEEYNALKTKIESLFENSPAVYDKTISGKSARRYIPSLVTGLVLGLLVGVGLYAVCKWGMNIYINSVVLHIAFVPIMFIISMLIACVVPCKNHKLYSQLKIKHKYAGYNTSKDTAYYVDDIRGMVDSVEVEISDLYKSGQIRQEIEDNYKSAKRRVSILFCIFVIFFVITMLL